MNWKSFIARRYLRGTDTSSGLSAQSLIGVAGVTLGVAALLIVQAVMAGFTQKLRAQMVGATAPVLLHFNSNAADLPEEDVEALIGRIESLPGVTGTTPFYRKEAMIARGEDVGAIRLVGVRPADASKATVFPDHMKIGSFESLKGGEVAGIEDPFVRDYIKGREGPRIILGTSLARAVNAEPGDEVRVICPMCGIGPFGPTASVKTFVVAGLFEVGNVEYDGQLGFVEVSEAAHFFEPERQGSPFSGIQVAVEDIEQADTIAGQIQMVLGDMPAWVTHWKRLLGPLFDALQLEKLALFFVLLIIVVVAAFNIAGMEILFVREKTHDIAILKAMGAPSAEITRVFLAKGAFVGFVGTSLGLALGLGFCWAQETFHLIQVDASVYQMSYMPVLVLPWDVVKVLVAPTMITTFAAYLPARRAGKLPPAEALRSD